MEHAGALLRTLRLSLCIDQALVCRWAEECAKTLYARYLQREGEGM